MNVVHTLLTGLRDSRLSKLFPLPSARPFQRAVPAGILEAALRGWPARAASLVTEDARPLGTPPPSNVVRIIAYQDTP